jgi:hypothetical protein
MNIADFMVCRGRQIFMSMLLSASSYRRLWICEEKELLTLFPYLHVSYLFFYYRLSCLLIMQSDITEEDETVVNSVEGVAELSENETIHDGAEQQLEHGGTKTRVGWLWVRAFIFRLHASFPSYFLCL